MSKLPIDYLDKELLELEKKIDEHPLMQGPDRVSEEEAKWIIPRRSSRSIIRTSIDDIIYGIVASKLSVEQKRPSIAEQTVNFRMFSPKQTSPYIKVLLRKTWEIVLFEQRSMTASLDSEEGQLVLKDNANYEALLQCKDHEYRIRHSGTQTRNVSSKTREVNTDSITKAHVGSYVSNFEMFDTYKDLEKSTKSLMVDDEKKIEITTYKVHGVDKFLEINETVNFKLALMLTMRILAGNVYEKQQRRFRNMSMPDPLATNVRYKYRLELLWQFEYDFQLSNFVDDENDNDQNDKGNGNDCKLAVADMCWCPSNGDILAAAYGIYTLGLKSISKGGMVCIWNIKNPVNPEKIYLYESPVVSIEFSPYQKQLLAVGLYNGHVLVLDISELKEKTIGRSERLKFSSCEPITAIKWIRHSTSDVKERDIEPFLALSQNGSVIKYRVVRSPYLLGFEQIKLTRCDGHIEGIKLDEDVASDTKIIQANRSPQGLDMSLDPRNDDIFYVLTDEGCIHKCSLNYPQQHLTIQQAHQVGVNSMEFSPWSPKLFLTCGNDWCIRIWLDGIIEPLFCLRNHMGPIHCAFWSRTHSTIIVSINRKTIDIWDIRLSTLKPISSTTVDKTQMHTMGKLSNCGRSMAVGTENGNIYLLAFEDMPFAPYFQYRQLHKAILNALERQPDLKKQVQTLGFFGYPNKKKASLI